MATKVERLAAAAQCLSAARANLNEAVIHLEHAGFLGEAEKVRVWEDDIRDLHDDIRIQRNDLEVKTNAL